MLIITGSLAYNYIMDFPGFFSEHILPDQLHQINLSFIASNFAKTKGGTAGTVSYTLALLDTNHILFSAVGGDFDEYKTAFTKLGINMNYVKEYKNEYTATGFAMTDKANNQIWSFFYGAMDHIPSLQLKKIPGNKNLLLIGPQGAKGSLSFVKQCVDLDISYMFDPGFILTQVNDEDLAFGISHAEFIIANDYEINLIAKRVKNFEKVTKQKTVITTFGEKGAVIQKNDEKVFINPVKPKTVVDSAGAGDTWRGGFLAGFARGFDLKTCGQMGAVAATYCIENYGTQAHRFTKKQFAKRYNDSYNEVLKI